MQAMTHQENQAPLIQILFIDLYSALNSIQSHNTARKLLKLDVAPRLILRTVDIFVDCFHYISNS